MINGINPVSFLYYYTKKSASANQQLYMAKCQNWQQTHTKDAKNNICWFFLDLFGTGKLIENGVFIIYFLIF